MLQDNLLGYWIYSKLRLIHVIRLQQVLIGMAVLSGQCFCPAHFICGGVWIVFQVILLISTLTHWKGILVLACRVSIYLLLCARVGKRTIRFVYLSGWAQTLIQHDYMQLCKQAKPSWVYSTCLWQSKIWSMPLDWISTLALGLVKMNYSTYCQLKRNRNWISDFTT